MGAKGVSTCGECSQFRWYETLKRFECGLDNFPCNKDDKTCWRFLYLKGNTKMEA
jgi:hypothetical protein